MFKRYLIICIFLVFAFGCADNRYRSEKLFFKAQKQASAILKKGPKNLTPGDYRRLINIYQKVADACPLEDLGAESQFIIADLYILQNDLKASQRQLSQVANNFFSKPQIASRAMYMAGQIYESQDKWEKAFDVYEDLIKRFSVTKIGLSLPLYIVGHWQKINDFQSKDKACRWAAGHYEKVIEEFSDTDTEPLVQNYLAFLYVMKGDYSRAQSVWDEIISEYPRHPQAQEAMLLKAETYRNHLKDTVSAIAAYKDFLKRYPGFAREFELKTTLGFLYLEAGKNNEARELFQNIIDSKPKDDKDMAAALTGLSQYYRKEANTAKVLGIYEKIRKLYPGSKTALKIPYLTAQYYDELEFHSKADNAFKEAISYYEMIIAGKEVNDEKIQEVSDLLALCYIKKKESDQALKLLRQLADKYPDKPEYLLDMAGVYNNLNARSKAIDVYKELIVRHPEDGFLVDLAESKIKNLEKE
ncbi:MAG: tetratricopeptide repeat protein [Candidatus Omnitrophota bacterium]